jgi:hypothetical protein
MCHAAWDGRRFADPATLAEHRRRRQAGAAHPTPRSRPEATVALDALIARRVIGEAIPVS